MLVSEINLESRKARKRKEELQKNGGTYFFRENIFNIIITFIVTLVTYIPKLFHYSYGIDTDQMMLLPEPTLSWWLSLNRYGLVFLKRILPYKTKVDVFLLNGLTYFLLFTSAVLLLYLVWRTHKIKSTKFLFFGAILYITSPTIIEQTNFLLQSVEVMLALNLLLFGIIFTQKFTEKRKPLFLIVAVILTAFSFSVYQSLQISFVVLSAGSLYVSLDKVAIKFSDFIKKASQYIVVLFLSYGLYYGGNQLVHLAFNVPKTDYFSGATRFQGESISKYLSMVKKIIDTNFFKQTQYYFLFLTALLIIAIVVTIIFTRPIMRKCCNLLCLLAFILSILFLPVFLGWIGPIRSYAPIVSLSLFFLSLMIFDEIKTINISKILRILLLLIFMITVGIMGGKQAVKTYSLGKTTYVLYNNEKKIANQIIKESRRQKVKNISEYKLVTYGAINFAKLNLEHGDMIGISEFNFDTGLPTGNSHRVSNFLNIEGYPIGWISNREEYQKLASFGATMPNYPNKGFVKVEGKYIIVKLSD